MTDKSRHSWFFAAMIAIPVVLFAFHIRDGEQRKAKYQHLHDVILMNIERSRNSAAVEADKYGVILKCNKEFTNLFGLGPGDDVHLIIPTGLRSAHRARSLYACEQHASGYPVRRTDIVGMAIMSDGSTKSVNTDIWTTERGMASFIDIEPPKEVEQSVFGTE